MMFIFVLLILDVVICKSSSSSPSFLNSVKKRDNKRATPTCTYKTIFDARQQWPACAPIINKVQDQSTCGNAWAVSTASAFSDRYCINRVKKGESIDANSTKNHFSALELIACAVGNPDTFHGCDGGSLIFTWKYPHTNGIVTGTDFGTHDGCMPYPFAPNLTADATAPKCVERCTNSAWKTAFKADRKFAASFNYMVLDDQTSAGNDSTMRVVTEQEQGGEMFQNIRKAKSAVDVLEKEIKANGPVVATFEQSDDIGNYTAGVYKATANMTGGYQALRLIGWGKQKCTDGTGQDYWIGVNTWGTGWGQNGFIYFAKGVDECGIESSEIGWGTPLV